MRAGLPFLAAMAPLKPLTVPPTNLVVSVTPSGTSNSTPYLSRQPSVAPTASTTVLASRTNDGATTHLLFQYGGELVAGIYAAELLFAEIKDLSIEQLEGGQADGWVSLSRDLAKTKEAVLSRGPRRGSREVGGKEAVAETEGQDESGKGSGSVGG